MELSDETKSKAYSFMKALLQDGADGEQINQLVNDMGEYLGKDIAGGILMDLLRNPEDVHADVKHQLTWFGPVDSKYYSAIAKAWTDWCVERDIRGHMRFGSDKEWDSWAAKTPGTKKNDLETLKKRVSPNLIVCEWWSDDLVTREANDFITFIYEQTKDEKE